MKFDIGDRVKYICIEDAPYSYAVEVMGKDTGTVRGRKESFLYYVKFDSYPHTLPLLEWELEPE